MATLGIGQMMLLHTQSSLELDILNHLSEESLPVILQNSMKDIYESQPPATIIPLSIDTIPQALEALEALRQKILSCPVILATDLYLTKDLRESLQQSGIRGLLEFYQDSVYTQLDEKPEYFSDFTLLYRELLSLIDAYMKGNVFLLFKQNSLCNTLVKISPLIVCVIDLTGKILFLNMKELVMKRFPKLIGDITDKRIHDFTSHPDKIDYMIQSLTRPEDPLDVYETDLLINYDETNYNFTVSAKKLLLYNMTVILLIGINVTEQKRTEEKLRESEKKYRMLVENSTDGICIIKDEKIIYANPRFLHIFNLDSTDFTEPLKFTDLIVKEERIIFSRACLYKIHPNETIEMRGLKKCGSVIDLEIALSSFHMFEDSFFQIIVRDITLTKNLWRGIVQSEKISAVGELVTGISHEFNNILTSLRGYTQFAMNNANNPVIIRESLEIIDRMTLQGAGIIKKLGLLTRQEIVNREDIFLTEIVDDILSIQEKVLLHEDIQIHRKYFNNPRIHADRGLIQQVFLNLIVNAIHAIRPKKKGIITVTVDNDDQWAKMTVHDTGQGIDPTIAEEVFTPFFTTKREGDIIGTGMGLAISKNIIQQHNGDITFKSTPGIETEFTLKLPVYTDKSSDPIIQSKPLSLDEQILPDLPVLIADDDPAIRELLKTILSTYGITDITMAKNGLEALEYAESKDFFVIFLDISMPVMSGLQAFQKISLIKPDAKIVFITGLFQELQIREMSEKQNAHGYIIKPFDIAEIKKLIRALLYP